MSALLELSGISASYGGRRILQDVSLYVASGEIATIVGHNGSGKSTLLKTVFNLVPWRQGVIRLEGRDLAGLPPDRILAAGIAYIPQNRSVFPRLTIAENLRMGAYLLSDAGLARERIAAVEALFPLLVERRGQLAGTMSGGEQRTLEVARALLMDPKLIMLDEPSIGLAPKMVDAVFRTVRLLRDQGKAVLMVEQNVNKALSISDRGYVMELGQIRLEERATTLIGDERVKRLYMGRRPSAASS
ncbi:MAG TPA: ABC transporter ATP-binding protein [Burkholderiales bacterium]|nr:ABC transporter ATP-binding protein [Burkholderiales bacterium]